MDSSISAPPKDPAAAHERSEACATPETPAAPVFQVIKDRKGVEIVDEKFGKVSWHDKALTDDKLNGRPDSRYLIPINVAALAKSEALRKKYAQFVDKQNQKTLGKRCRSEPCE
jgi:hypothetical protein